MLLNVIVDEQSLDLNVPDGLILEAEPFFERMDQDMAAGWQMSRDWVEAPDRTQRCQIAADKLLSALEKENRKLAMMMAGYLLSRMPGLKSVDIDSSGEMSSTRFTLDESPQASRPVPAGVSATQGGMSKLDALQQAAQDVTKVFKVGRNWRFSVFDHGSGQWRDAPAVSDQQQAEMLREQAYKQRFEELIGRTGSA